MNIVEAEMEDWDNRFQVTVFANTDYKYTFYLIPTLVKLIFMECVLLLVWGVWGVFGIMIAHHAPKWAELVLYVAVLFGLHWAALVGVPLVCCWLIRRIRHTPSGLRNFRLLQAAALAMTGGCVWFLWPIL